MMLPREKIESKIKLGIFDMGGVVIKGGFDVLIDISKALKLQPDKFLSIGGENLNLLLIGKIDSGQFWERFSRDCGFEIEDDLWSRFFKPVLNQRCVNLISRLKKFIRIVAGTNTIESHYLIQKKRKYYHIFDAVYASCKIGFAKPESKFFNYIMEFEGCKPAETIFIDDQKENVRAAKELGIKGILFRTAEILEKDLSITLPYQLRQIWRIGFQAKDPERK